MGLPFTKRWIATALTLEGEGRCPMAADPHPLNEQSGGEGSGISLLAEASHLCYTLHATAQHQTRVKLNRVFFPR